MIWYEYVLGQLTDTYQGTVAYWLRPTAYNGVNGVQFSTVLPAGLAIW